VEAFILIVALEAQGRLRHPWFPQPIKEHTMQIQIHAGKLNAPRELGAWTEARVRFVLRRLAPQLNRATVQLKDVDGARHGVDKRCLVEVVGQDGQRVVARAMARQWQVAVLMALDKCIEALRRAAGKRRARLKSAPQALDHTG
jgi:hypothetical protein